MFLKRKEEFELSADKEKGEFKVKQDEYQTKVMTAESRLDAIQNRLRETSKSTRLDEHSRTVKQKLIEVLAGYPPSELRAEVYASQLSEMPLDKLLNELEKKVNGTVQRVRQEHEHSEDHRQILKYEAKMVRQEVRRNRVGTLLTTKGAACSRKPRPPESIHVRTGKIQMVRSDPNRSVTEQTATQVEDPQQVLIRKFLENDDA